MEKKGRPGRRLGGGGRKWGPEVDEGGRMAKKGRPGSRLRGKVAKNGARKSTRGGWMAKKGRTGRRLPAKVAKNGARKSTRGVGWQKKAVWQAATRRWSKKGPGSQIRRAHG